jgi:epoxide hydrolase A/B
MNGLTHRFIETNGIRMHVAEQGEGPLILLCHGFPELWYSWRYQLEALAAAGFRAVAPDMRGYGNTDRPEAIDQYTLLHLVGDMVGVLDALDQETAVIAGHDWGAVVAWHAALLRPDRFRAVIGLSVPFIPDYTSKSYPQSNDTVFYQSYFQSPGVAEADLECDVQFTMRAFLYEASGDAHHPAIKSEQAGHVFMVPRKGGMMANWVNPPSLPSWLTEADIGIYVDLFNRTGYRGGLNWNRNIDRNSKLMAPFVGSKITNGRVRPCCAGGSIYPRPDPNRVGERDSNGGVSYKVKSSTRIANQKPTGLPQSLLAKNLGEPAFDSGGDCGNRLPFNCRADQVVG